MLRKRFSQTFKICLALMLSVLSSGILQVAPAYAYVSNPDGKKAAICKYISTPSGGEQLQGGGNPIVVDRKDDMIIGSSFTDGQERSVVIAFLNNQDPQPTISDCPAPRGPVSVTPPVLTAPTCDAAGIFVGIDTAQYTFVRTGPDTAAVLTATAVGDITLAAPTVFGPYDLTQLTGEQCEEDPTLVTPVVMPTHQTSVCAEDIEVFTSGSITVTAITGLHYWLEGSEITGTVPLEPGTYEVSFTTDAGVELAAGVTSPVSVTINAAAELNCEVPATCPANEEWFDVNQDGLVTEDECFKKVFVCKYVGTPGIDERLQTGDNPINVSVHAIPDPENDGVHVGDEFADAHGRSIVIAFDEGQPEPSVANCPTPQEPQADIDAAAVCTANGIKVTLTNSGNADGTATVNGTEYEVAADSSREVTVPFTLGTPFMANVEVTVGDTTLLIQNFNCAPGQGGGQTLGTSTTTPQVLGSSTELPATLPATGGESNPFMILIASLIAYGAAYFLQGRRQLSRNLNA